VGYPDETFVGYKMHPTAGHFVKFEKFWYADGEDNDLNAYYANSRTGYAADPNFVGPSSSSPDFITTSRPWYSGAAAEKGPVWSPPYFFAGYNAHRPTLGMTYAIPFYENDGKLAGVIGIDFSFAQSVATLMEYGNSGKVYYAVETDSSPQSLHTAISSDYNMLMASSEANIINDAETRQVKAWEADGVKDYMVSKSAKYMKDIAWSFDGEFSVGPLDCSVLEYNAFNLFWRFVGVSYQYPGAAANDNSGSGSDNSNTDVSDTGSTDYDKLLSLVNSNENVVVSLLVIAIFHFLITLATFFQRQRAKKQSAMGKSQTKKVKFASTPGTVSSPMNYEL